MTEYWVSQGNKWCDFCKIWIQNNPTSIRNHELGKRHKECVDKKLTDMREKSAAKDKELKKNEKLLQQIEAKATRSYQKDIATAQQVAKANGAPEDGTAESSPESESVPSFESLSGWMLDSASGYYYNQTNGLHYDSKSGFYYSDSIGHWVTQDEAYAAVKTSSDKGTKVPLVKKPLVTSSEAGPSVVKPPGRLVSASLNPKRVVKGAPSSVDLGNNKRKRQDEKPKKVSAEEKAALRAREAARKRVEEREKPLLGLYNRPF